MRFYFALNIVDATKWSINIPLMPRYWSYWSIVSYSSLKTYKNKLHIRKTTPFLCSFNDANRMPVNSPASCEMVTFQLCSVLFVHRLVCFTGKEKFEPGSDLSFSQMTSQSFTPSDPIFQFSKGNMLARTKHTYSMVLAGFQLSMVERHNILSPSWLGILSGSIINPTRWLGP